MLNLSYLVYVPSLLFFWNSKKYLSMNIQSINMNALYVERFIKWLFQIKVILIAGVSRDFSLPFTTEFQICISLLWLCCQQSCWYFDLVDQHHQCWCFRKPPMFSRTLHMHVRILQALLFSENICKCFSA